MFNSYEITDFYENVIPHLDDVPLDAVVPNCMEQLFSENNLEADRIVTAMPGQFISSRILPFNFSDPRKIEQAAFALVEEAVPFNMDDMILDHQILGAQGSKTLALAVMTRKAFLKNFLDLLQRISIDPKLVDIDSLAFYNLSSYMNVDPDECFAMVDVGHEKTSLCIVRNGVLKMFRSINLGGRYVTEFLARDLEVSFHEAQRVKHKYSSVLCSNYQGEDLSGDDRLIAERMTLACNAIVKELGRTLYSFKTWEKRPLSKLFLSGGTSLIRNFSTFLEDQLEVDCVPVHLDKTSLEISDALTDRMQIIPQSVAIGMRAVTVSGRKTQKYSQINLRKGEFAYIQNYESVLKSGISAFRVVAIIMLLFAASYLVQRQLYVSEIDSLQAKYKKQFLTVFRDQKKSVQRKSTNFTSLRKYVNRHFDDRTRSMQGAIESFIEENSGSLPLLTLKSVSELIPQNLTVDVSEFQIKANKLEVKGYTDNYQQANDILDLLKKSKYLNEVKKDYQRERPGSKGQKIDFKLKALVETPHSNKG